MKIAARAEGDREVVLALTGTANTASVRAAFERRGARTVLAGSARDIERARHVVLPGVGAFGAGASGLREGGLFDALRERVLAGRPTLAICLGLQLLCAGSDETPGVDGLGIVPDRTRRLEDAPRVPQLGWNRVEPEPGCALVEPGWAYFAHTFCLTEAPEGWNAAFTEYGGPFASALERGAVLACQFHPELSGAWGAALLERWLGRGEEVPS